MSRTLFAHQSKSIEKMLECESRIEIEMKSRVKFRSTYGILANPIGSGKTLTMLSLLHNHPLTIDNCKTVIFGDSSVQLDIKDYLMDPASQGSGFMFGNIPIPRCQYIPYQLVLCTKPLVNEWIKEAGVAGIPIRPIFTPTLVKTMVNDPPEPHSIIVVYPELLQETISALSQISPNPMLKGCAVFERVVMDDIHMANNWSHAKYSLLSLFTWFLSATPNVLDGTMLTSKLRRACSIFSAYGMISPLAHMVHVDTVNEYVEPPVVPKYHYVMTHWASDAMAGVLTDEVKHMLNIGDYTGLRNHFKTILGDEEDVCRPIHDLVLSSEIKELVRLIKSKERFIENDMSTENVDAKIESQQRKIDGIRERVSVVNQEEAECPICMCDVERKEMTITPCCYNMFCKECIHTEIKARKACPTCRASLKKSQLMNITDSGDTISLPHIAQRMDEKKIKSKGMYKTCFEAIEKIMSQDYKKKYIIFTETADSVLTYKKYLSTNSDVKLVTLSGRLNSMKKNIESLREGLANGMFLNSGSMEAGLNLQFVDEIILVGKSDNDRLKQAIGRVRRYPRTEPVIVNYVAELVITE